MVVKALSRWAPRQIAQAICFRVVHIAAYAEAVQECGLPELLVSFGGGIGDSLLCTALFREMRARGYSNVWMMSDFAELFQGNRDIGTILPRTITLARLTRALGRPVVSPIYTRYIAAEDRDVPPPRHIIAETCYLAGLRGEVALRPYMSLSADERARGTLAPRQIAIHSSGLAARYPMRNKEWFPERFQAVVDALRDEYTFVQLGAASDPVLLGALDLRGTTSLRETAAILHRSALFIGQVGFLMHMARAVDTRAVIVYGGREMPEQTGYVCNENLYSAVPCAPCWKWNDCPFERRCMRLIEPEAVVAAARRQLARVDEPLDVEIATLV